MAANEVAFLYKAACSLPNDHNNEKIKLLKSYYLMRCQQITNGHNLPEKQFSTKTRCPKCCTEWRNGSDVKLKPVKLSKKQRRRIRKLKPSKERDDKMDLPHSNQIEQTCLFCKNITTTNVKKPESVKTKIIEQSAVTDFIKDKSKTMGVKNNERIKPVNKKNLKKATEVKPAQPIKDKVKTPSTGVNIYGTAKDVFSLKNKDNILQSSVKVTPKVIKNNKRKKDKFAGLSQKAVLASMKMKVDKEKQHKINLFLKPSG